MEQAGHKKNGEKFEWVCTLCKPERKIISFNKKILNYLARSHLATMHDLSSEELNKILMEGN